MLCASPRVLGLLGRAGQLPSLLDLCAVARDWAAWFSLERRLLVPLLTEACNMRERQDLLVDTLLLLDRPAGKHSPPQPPEGARLRVHSVPTPSRPSGHLPALCWHRRIPAEREDASASPASCAC